MVKSTDMENEPCTRATLEENEFDILWYAIALQN